MAQKLQIRLRRGLDLPVAGSPRQEICAAPPVSQVGIVGRDYPGLRLGPLVEEGARVALGEAVLRDRAEPRITCTAPAAGVVVAINRGERRSLRSRLAVRLSDAPLSGNALE